MGGYAGRAIAGERGHHAAPQRRHDHRGYHPQVLHGESMAVFCPEFTRFTYPYAVEQFATMGRIFDPGLEAEPDDVATKRSCEVLDAFLRWVGLWLTLADLGVSEVAVEWIARHSLVLRVTRNNPKVVTRNEVYDMLEAGYRR